MQPAAYWVSQFFVVFAYAFLGLGLQNGQKIAILQASCAFNILLGLQFALLAGTLGLIGSIIALARNALFIYNEKRGRGNPSWALLLFGGISVVLTVIFYRTPTDIFPCILTLIGLYAYWHGRKKDIALRKKVILHGPEVILTGTIVISACYIVYAIPLRSWLIVACEACMIIFTVMALRRFRRSRRFKCIQVKDEGALLNYLDKGKLCELHDLCFAKTTHRQKLQDLFCKKHCHERRGTISAKFEKYLADGILFFSVDGQEVFGFSAAMPLQCDTEAGNISNRYSVGNDISKYWHHDAIGVHPKYRTWGVALNLMKAMFDKIPEQYVLRPMEKSKMAR